MEALIEVTTNAALAERARRVIPGGVNSGNRVIAGMPMVIREAHGAYFTDVEGKRYLDYHAAFGPIILGHSHPRVREAVCQASEQIDLLGVGVTEMEIELAEKIAQHVPSAERVLLANSGSEATYQALRLARAVTGRNGIVKFQGAYHGWHDAVAMNVISAADKIGRRDLLSAGMLPGAVEHTHILPFNDVEAIADFLERRGEDIAAVLVEVIPHNIGCVLPRPGFLRALRDLCDKFGCLLIFDEVITGFRVAYGGAQAAFGVLPDLTCLGKVIGGGLPVGAYGGRRDLMEQVAPSGPVYQAGTLSGNPLATAAGLATLRVLRRPGVYEELERKGRLLADGLRRVLGELGLPYTVNHLGSLCTLFFTEGEVADLEAAARSDTAAYAAFFRGLLEEGVLVPPSQFETWFVSLAHSDEDIHRTVEACRRALRRV